MMKKLLLICSIFCLGSSLTNAQTTEDFESETLGSTTFSDNGHTFSISSTDGYDIETCPSCGWNGSAVDARFVDNSNAPGG
ncbi:MAG: T9SS C-terminal target domain-containing protein, partial [Flavobacteriales bacterium]|nr:T9SS C-terminal target domain-containing protein [Flavobacteriales bacterium]